jgi:hypothetical protein
MRWQLWLAVQLYSAKIVCDLWISVDRLDTSWYISVGSQIGQMAIREAILGTDRPRQPSYLTDLTASFDWCYFQEWCRIVTRSLRNICKSTICEDRCSTAGYSCQGTLGTTSNGIWARNSIGACMYGITSVNSRLPIQWSRMKARVLRYTEEDLSESFESQECCNVTIGQSLKVHATVLESTTVYR